jgi:serine/threonine protein phosphatase PrpC
MTLALRYAVRSDVGLLREGNEDSAYAGPHLLAVADGMGGHAAGEVASSAAIVTLSSLDAEYPEADLVNALANAVADANKRLQELIYCDPATEGMGTTLTAMLWSQGHAALCHIGDSRAYLLRQGELYQITHDHTLVQSLVDEGRITEDDVATHPQRSLLLRALDGRTLAEPDLSTLETLAGDRYLLCSDGLSGVVTEQTIQHALGAIADPEQAALSLVELAIRGGGPDNITCIVADVVDTGGAAPQTEPVTAGAAANGTAPQVARQNSPAGRAHRLTQTAPQQALPDEPESWSGNGNRGGRRARHSRDDEPDDFEEEEHTGRRRWPIVTTSLILLIVVVLIGGYIGYQYTQSQYYVGEDAGQVTIFRGINQNIAGVSLSKLYSHTGIPVSQVNDQYMGQISATISAGSLSQAQQTVSSIRSSVNNCKAAWNALVTWNGQEVAYQAQVSAHRHNSRIRITMADPTKSRPPTPGNECAPYTAFGIPVSALPANAVSASPVPSQSPSPTPSPGKTA